MPLELEKIKKIVDKVGVFITNEKGEFLYNTLMNEEGEFLYNTAKNCRGRGVIVEIGSWVGKSTLWLGKGSKAGNRVKISAIDPHTGSLEHREIFGNVWTFEEFKKNIQTAELDDIIFPIVKTSAEAAQTFHDCVEFLFIDGDHRYEMVKLDFELWSPKLLEEGIIAFHDSGCLGVRKVVEKFIYKSRTYKNIGIVHSILFAQKVKENSIRDRLRNRLLLFFGRCTFVYHKLPFPMPVTHFRKKFLKLIK